MRLLLALALAACLGACGGGPPVVADGAQLPPGALGSGPDTDTTALGLAQYAFADSGRTYGRPLEAARAAAALMYLAGAVANAPRWTNVPADTKDEMLQGRAQLRTALGVAPGATAQQVVDGLLAAATALAAGDRAAAAAALNTAAFPAGGEQTLATLANLPYLRMANLATEHLEAGEFEEASPGQL